MTLFEIIGFWLIASFAVCAALYPFFAINPREDEDAEPYGDPVNYDADRTPSWRKM